MKAKTTFQRHGKAVAALLSAVLCCFLIGGCKRDVHYEIDHELRAIELDRTSQTLAVRYDILERQVWQQSALFLPRLRGQQGCPASPTICSGISLSKGPRP